MNVYAILLAGGMGKRMGDSIPKQFLELQDKPLIIWTLEALAKSSLVNQIVIAIHPDYRNILHTILTKYNLTNNTIIVNGGQSRQQSCYNALVSLVCNNDDIILIHDAARPFITSQMIKECIENSKQHGACGIYTPVKETIATVEENTIIKVLQRHKLCTAQTPQSFRYSIILDAHNNARKKNITDATDDISLAVNAGYAVKAIIGNFYFNIKITTTEDLIIAQSLLQHNPEFFNQS